MLEIASTGRARLLHQNVLAGLGKRLHRAGRLAIRQTDDRTVEVPLINQPVDGGVARHVCVFLFQARHRSGKGRDDGRHINRRANMRQEFAPARSMRVVDPDEGDAKGEYHRFLGMPHECPGKSKDRLAMDDFRGYSTLDPPTALLPRLPTMRRPALFLAVIVLGVAAPLQAADVLALFPPTLTLDGLDARQQLVLTETSGGKQADRTTSAAYSTNAPGVAIVSPAGVVTPVGDGEAIITASAANKSATMIVKVKNAAAAKPVTFERDIQPILTRAGCNAGACHGKARGQNGFQLSLLAYDNDFDFNAITTEARGRRIFPANPAFSLLLRKPSGQMPHGGGKKFAGGKPRLPHARKVDRGRLSANARRLRRRLERITVFPDSRLDGLQRERSNSRSRPTTPTARTRDVTHLAQFSSSESVYAAVDANGQVKAGPIPGEAAIMARFMEKFAVVNMLIPLPTPVDAAVYEKLPRNNFIDGLVWAKLKQLNITPSELAAMRRSTAARSST